MRAITAILLAILALTTTAYAYERGEVLGWKKKKAGSHYVFDVGIWGPEEREVTVEKVPQRLMNKVKVGKIFPYKIMKIPGGAGYKLVGY